VSIFYRCGRNLTCDVVALCTLVSGRTVFVCGVVESVGISQGVGWVWQTAAGSRPVRCRTSVSNVYTIDTNTQPASFWALCHCHGSETRNYQTTWKVGFWHILLIALIIHYRPNSVCPSVNLIHLWCCALWLNVTFTAKLSEGVNRQCPLLTRFCNFQPPTLTVSAETSPPFIPHTLLPSGE